MNKELIKGLQAAFLGQASANFSSDEVETAAVNALLKEIGLDSTATTRDIRAKEEMAFALIEEAVDEILPKKLEDVLGSFAEVRTFPRDAEVVFNIEKIGKNRAKLTISKGARGGIYRAAKLDRKQFGMSTSIQTVAVYVTLEEIILGTMSLGELWSNILEGFQEIVYKEVFNALASAQPVAGYDRIGGNNVTTAKADLGGAIDRVMPYVKQYGVPTIFGSYQAVSSLSNPASEFHPELVDSADRRSYGFVQLYKGSKVVELPNYLVDNSNKDWFYDPSFVFILPSGIKPVKVALKGEMYIQRNKSAVGTEKWEASKLMGVGIAMANNFAVIKVTDLD